MAHALRNPLSSVKIALQAMDRDAPPPHARRARLALREVRKMERLLSAVAECGSSPHMLTHVCDVSDLVSSCAADVEEELALRQTCVNVLGDVERGSGRCDAGRVRPLLAQLLLECADRRGGRPVEVKLRAREAAVELQLPLVQGVRGSSVTTCVEALGLLLAPGGGGVEWGEDGSALVIRFPAAR